MPFTRLRQSLIQPNGSITGSLLGTASYAITSSYAMNGGSGGGSTPVVSVASLNNQTILYNFSSSQEATITGLTLTNNNWGINVVEEWNSGSIVGDEYYNSCSLLMHFSGSNGSTTFIDNSPTPKTVTPVGNAQISTAQSKFGGSSGYFDGAGDYLTLSSDAAFGTGTGNFTIEFWMYPVSVASGYVFDNRTGGAVQSVIGYFSAAGSFTFTGGIITTGVTKTSITANSWYHVACVRNSGTVYLFVDGVSAGTDTVAGSANSSNPFTIGSKYDGTNGFNGYIDDFRYTKGVARYTSSFTVPSSAFPDSSGSFQLQTKYVGLVGGLNDTNVDYGVEKLSDTSLKIRKMSVSGTPVSGSPFLSSSVDRVYVNVLNYTNISAGSTLLGQAFTAVGSTSSYALSRSVVNPYEIVVAVDGAVQSFNDAYSVTSSTINFTENIPSGSLVDIRYLTTPNVNSASYAATSSYSLCGGTTSGKSIALSFILG